jgi:hypothetical protein
MKGTNKNNTKKIIIAWKEPRTQKNKIDDPFLK